MAETYHPVLEKSLSSHFSVTSIKQEKYFVTLQQAVRNGNEDEVIETLSSITAKKRQKVLNAFDAHGFTAVHYAARFNRLRILEILYLEKPDVNVKTTEGLTPLHYAARYTPVFKSQSSAVDGNGLHPQHEDITAPLEANKRIIQHLVSWKVNVNVQDKYGVTPLHLACSRGNRVAVEVLLAAQNININIQDKKQDTPLHDACIPGDEVIIEMLLDNGADVLISNDENLIPLHIACREGYTEVVKLMMRKKFSHCNDMVTSCDNQNNTPLHFACRSGSVEIVKILLMNRADPAAAKHDGITPMHIAARDDFVEIAEVLMECEGLDVNVKDEELNTPLHLAAKHNNVEMINFLLKRGADIEAQDESSNTPLLTAVAHGQKEAMETLLVNKCLVDVVNRNGKSIVFIAAEKNQAELLKSMLNGSVAEYCEDLLSTTDSTNNTPMHIACAKGNIEALKVLLRSSIKVDARNEADKTPMHLAAANGHTNIVKELIRHGKKIKIDLIVDEDDDSNTPLHLACAKGHYVVAKVLLEAEADPDVRNGYHWTPLAWAASKGWERTVQLLIDFEAEVDPKDKAGVSPLLLACQEGHLKVVEALLANGAKASNTNTHHENALDIAVENGRKDVAMAIVNSNQMEEALRNTSQQGEKIMTPLRRIIKRMPEVAEVIFNRCAVTNSEEVAKEHPDYSVTFNYEFLEDFSEEIGDEDSEKRGKFVEFTRKAGEYVSDAVTEIIDEATTKTSNSQSYTVNEDQETTNTLTRSKSNEAGHFSTDWGPRGFNQANHCLHLLTKSKSIELLRHPLVTSLLNHKWKSFGQMVYYGNLFIYTVFIGFLTLFALIVPFPSSNTCKIPAATNETMSSDDGLSDSECQGVARRIGIALVAVTVILFALIKLVFEFLQLLKLGYKYFYDWVNFLEIVLYLGSIIFVAIFGNNCFCPTGFQWQLGALCLFLGWIDLVIYMRTFPITGIYVVMFMNIFFIFLKLAFLAALLILSFAFSFFMLFHDPDNAMKNIRTPFHDPGRSIIKTMTMTTGEFEFDDTFRQGGDSGPDLEYAAVSYILWILFLVLMPILLTNLLVGLAVDDIKGIQETAELNRLALRVELTLSVEELLPRRLRRKFVIGQRTILPNRKLKLWEKIKYKVLQFKRFDDLETISNGLTPPSDAIDEVVDQNTLLNKKVDDMQLQLEALSDQNAKLMETLDIVIKRDLMGRASR